VPLLGERACRQLLAGFNDTAVAYPRDLLVHQLFEVQAARQPDAVALQFEDRQLSYAQLNARANRLAHRLLALGVRPDDRVAICAERSIEMVVGLLAILKSGAAYVPLDPAYPADRLAYMLADSAPAVLLAQPALADLFGAPSMPLLPLREEEADDASGDAANPDPAALGLHASHLAYVIYTSGSTGMPKGVMNQHGGVVNRLLWAQDEYRLTPEDRVLQKTPFGFDVSVWEFFLPLLAGARLVVARPGGHMDPHYLYGIVAGAGISVMHFVPSMLHAFVGAAPDAAATTLRHVLCSGEALPYSLQLAFAARMPQVALHNLYGPTEAAIDVTYWRCHSSLHAGGVPIGRPIANTSIYILDSHGQPVPIGVVGELHIGGVQVARGYLNRPELTAERFVPDPFSTEADARMYRTGDLGRWLADGNIEYLGRNDFQVKIRGFRIELGVFDAALAACAGV
jgi:amino acid adenylation domain-containing protein